MVALHENDAAEPQRYRVTAKGSMKYSNASNFSELYGSGRFEAKGNLSISRGVTVRLDYSMDNPALAAAGALGLTNPLQLAWELLPFSFVADWFVPIGAYLSAWDADLGYSFRGGSNTTRQVSTLSAVTLDITSKGLAETNFKSYHAYGGFRHQKRVTRSTYGSSPLPRFPGMKNPFSATHVMNAIALLGSAVR